MFKNYFKLAWRSLIKNKLPSLINISGLAVGLGTAILIMLWIYDEASYNKFHVNLPHIFLLMQHQNRGGDISTGSSVPGPLAAMLRTDLPEVKSVARISFPDAELMRTEDKNFYMLGMYADPEFFKIMSFPAIAGDPEAALREPGSVVITKSTAIRLFGKENPIGKIIRHNNLNSLKIGAVVEDIPHNSSIHFDVILPFSLYEHANKTWINKWDNNRISTWIELNPDVKLAGLNEKLKKVLQVKQDDKNVELFAYPFSDLWLRGEFKNGRPNGGRIDGMMMLGLIGIFVLLIACINFMNLATARSEHRSREVGVRKTLGASKRQIIFQFLSEAILITLFAMILGVVLARLFLPLLNKISQKHISFDFLNLQIWIVILSMGLFTGLVAGSYPAFFLSSLNPVLILKGIIKNNRSGPLLRKGLVIFQFVISIFLIIITIVIFKQLQFVESRPLGYDQESLVEIPARGGIAGKYKILKNQLAQVPGIINISAGSDDLLGFDGAINDIQWPGKTPGQDFKITLTYVQYDWAKTAGIKMEEGRDFSTEFGADSVSCLVNQTAVKKMGLKGSVVGTKLGRNTIVGVMKDFVYDDPFASTKPMIVYLDTGNLSHFFVRMQNDDQWRSRLDVIGQIIKKEDSKFPVDFHFLKDEYQKKFTGIRSTGQLVNAIGCLAIFISCLGLFGLSAFLAERRTKEIGIRKVLGASVGSVWLLLSLDFLKPVFIAFVLATPLAAWIMQKQLLTMDYHIALSWWIFALAGMLAISIAIITVSFQGIKAAIASPAKSMRTE